MTEKEFWTASGKAALGLLAACAGWAVFLLATRQAAIFIDAVGGLAALWALGIVLCFVGIPIMMLSGLILMKRGLK